MDDSKIKTLYILKIHHLNEDKQYPKLKNL